MFRRMIVGLAVVASLAAPLRAELKYTMKIEAHPSAVPAAPSNDPLISMIGGIVVGTIAPAGGLELVVTVGERGTRVDYARGYMIVPAGGATIMKPDGSMAVLDPAKKTYWTMVKPDLTTISGMGASKVTMQRTGQFADVAGVRAERATIEIRLPLPVAADAPAGLPTEIVLTGETWLAPKYKAYAKLTAGLVGGMNLLGVDTMAGEGFMMRSILRGDLLGTQELESVVTAIAETPAPAGTFEIPAGYTEVPPPSGLGAIGGR
jgi:hypothetical protein